MVAILGLTTVRTLAATILRIGGGSAQLPRILGATMATIVDLITFATRTSSELRAGVGG